MLRGAGEQDRCVSVSLGISGRLLLIATTDEIITSGSHAAASYAGVAFAFPAR